MYNKMFVAFIQNYPEIWKTIQYSILIFLQK